MKHWNRFLAALLAVCMLWSMCGVMAETQVEIDPEQGLGATAPEIGDDALDLSLSLNEGLDLGGLISEDVPAANEADGLTSNSKDNPFVINDNGVLTKYTGEGGNVIVPDGVVAIGKKVFANNADIKAVTIPESVTQVRASAFYGCDALAYVTILAKDITIADNAFKKTSPVFRTVIGSKAAEWASKHKFTVEENVVVLTQNITMKAAIGDTYRIVLKFFKALRYVSGNPAIATVSDRGLVTVKNGGTVQIMVTMENQETLILTLTIPYPPASLSKTALDLKVGDSATLTVENLSGRTVSWSSDNPGIATVNQGKVTAVRAGKCVITATLSDGTVLKCGVTVTDPAKLNKTKLKLRVGKSYKLKVKYLAGRNVTWTSDNNGVATVQGGKVTARKAGTCTITAHVQNGNALQCKVTVTDPAKLNKTSLSLQVGGSATLQVSNLGGRTVTWSSNVPTVATVQGGKVTAHKAGKCTITAKLSEGKTLTCKVTVTDSAKLNKTSLTLKVGGSYKLKVKNLGGRKVTWSSDNTSVATVQGGKVTARKAGTCTITAKLSDGKTLTCKVTVTDSAKLNKTELKLKVGETFKLVATGQGTNNILWTSTDEKIATVDKTGLVKAIKAGKCLIKAKLSNGTILECKVTVKKK